MSKLKGIGGRGRGIKRHRRFNGKIYTLHQTHARKSEAQREARFHRRKGHQARVVKGANPRGIYAGKGPRNVYRVYVRGGGGRRR